MILVVVLLAAAVAWAVTGPARQPPVYCMGDGPTNRPGCPPDA